MAPDLDTLNSNECRPNGKGRKARRAALAALRIPEVIGTMSLIIVNPPWCAIRPVILIRS
jgi:hypothetical protein